jgi:2-oxoisovalerate dehydrogenase E2 component (dihydrolipoyl transacylase)
VKTVTTTTTAAADVLALPAVRHFARENGVDVTLLAPGSGKNGRVERVDVERYLAGGKSGSVSEQPRAVSAPPPAEDDVVVELGRTRYGMWKAMEKARTSCISSASAVAYRVVPQSLEIPHFG